MNREKNTQIAQPTNRPVSATQQTSEKTLKKSVKKTVKQTIEQNSKTSVKTLVKTSVRKTAEKKPRIEKRQVDVEVDEDETKIENQSYLVPQETIQRGNKFYLIKRTDDEPREMYLSRVNYIIDKLSTSTRTADMDADVVSTIEKSYIWRNVTFYKMTYPSAVLKIIL